MTKEKLSSKRTVFFCVMVLMLFPSRLVAQDQDRPEKVEESEQSGQSGQSGQTYGAAKGVPGVQYGIPRAGEVLIINGSPETLIPFYLKNGNSSYVEFELEPNGRGTYRHTTHIWIKTPNGNTAGLRVSYEHRYEIYWDADRWTIREISPK